MHRPGHHNGNGAKAKHDDSKSRKDTNGNKDEDNGNESGSGRGKWLILGTAGAGAAGAAAWAWRRHGSESGDYDGSLHTFQAIDVKVPVSTAYNQWTQFESFPRFMEGVEHVEQLDDRNLFWRANIGGRQEEFEAVITEQIPDERIAWRSTSGAKHAGVVTFHHLTDDTSRVALQMDAKPVGILERLGVALGAVEVQAARDLKHFKEFIESRGEETGAWRGTLEHRTKE